LGPGQPTREKISMSDYAKKIAPKKIATRHLLFVSEFLKDRNGTQAVIRAGFSSSGATSRAVGLLRRPDVRQLIEEEERKIMLETEVDQVWVIRQLKINMHRAIDAGELAVVNRCLELIGKQIGMFVERSSINLTVDQIDRVERRIIDPAQDPDGIDYSVDDLIPSKH